MPLPDAGLPRIHKFRRGLGYANLGALLMSMRLPYDSDGGRRDMAERYRADVRRQLRASARIAGEPRSFCATPRIASRCWTYIRMHRDSLRPLSPKTWQPSLWAPRNMLGTALALVEKFG